MFEKTFMALPELTSSPQITQMSTDFLRENTSRPYGAADSVKICVIRG
jgi:hypothetical protein